MAELSGGQHQIVPQVAHLVPLFAPEPFNTWLRAVAGPSDPSETGP